MKKILFLLIVIAVLVSSAAALDLWFTPSLDSMESVTSADDSIFLLEHRGGNSYIYRTDESGRIGARYKDSEKITFTTYSNDNLYFLRENNSTWQIVQISADLNLETIEIIHAGDYSLIERIIGFSGSEVTGITEDNLFVKINSNNEAVFISEEELPAPPVFDIGELEELKIPFSRRLALLEFPPFMLVLPQLLLSVFLILSAAFLLFTKNLVARTTAGFAFSLLLLFNVMTEVQTRDIRRTLIEGRLDEARRQSLYISDILDGVNFTVFNDLHYYNNENYAILSNYFGLFSDNSETGGAIRSELIFVTAANQPVVAISERFAYYLPAEDVFRGEIPEIINEVIISNEPMQIFFDDTAVSIAPAFYAGRVAALIITEISGRDTELVVSELRREYMQDGLIFIFFSVAVIFLLNRGFTSSLRRVVKRMKKYGDGKFEANAKVKSNGDVGAMERAISEMGVSLAISEYETKTMINSFYRFVPRGIEKLLNRSGVTEISSGDVVSVKDNLCILSVNNKEEALERIDDQGFMTFVNNCFSTIYEHVQNHNGMLLSGDFNLSALPILFTGNSDSKTSSAGIHFALNLIDSPPESAEIDVQPDFFLMLHHSKFLYGIAGTEEKAFPFLSSYEMNFLSSHSQNLRSLGARIVMTEQYFNKLPSEINVSNRFIGFISSQDGCYSYKLYEVLNCYSDSERSVRTGYDEKFQKAIRLFYKNDFYLARNEFSAILRSNPNDGVVRWYVFACEHFFNNDDLSKITYNLFGIKRIISSTSIKQFKHGERA